MLQLLPSINFMLPTPPPEITPPKGGPFLLEISNLLNNKGNHSLNCISPSPLSNDTLEEEKDIRSQKGRDKFTQEEDMKLKWLVSITGTKNWKFIAQEMGTKNVRQCRDRWKNYLNPSLNLGDWSLEEDMIIFNKFKELGPRWKIIAKFLRGRSPNSVRNRMKHLVNYPLRVQLETAINSHNL